MKSASTGMMTAAISRLLHLPPDANKDVLMSTIDGAVTEILSDLSTHADEDLSASELQRVQITIEFLSQCLDFNDEEFTNFAKKRASELQSALIQTLERIAKAQEVSISPEPEPAIEPEPALEPEAEVKPDEPQAKEAEPEPEEQSGFRYVREEKLLVQFGFDLFSKRLKFLRGDTIKVVNLKQVPVSGILRDGVSPIFFMSPKFPKVMEAPFHEMIKEKRDLYERRIYIFTNPEMSDQEVLNLYEEEYKRDIVMIIANEFDNWAGEMAKAGIGGLPQEKAPSQKKEEKDEAGIGSSLKKVFSFGGKKDKKQTKAKPVKVQDSLPVRTHKELQSCENKGMFHLSQHFSFSILSYVMKLNVKQFETEFECIGQIVNQQEEADVGPVVTNLSRLYKFYDNIFFDLVILVLFQRKNKFDVNMLQAACMSQNFVVDRLPLTMDELRRRPLEHAKYILKCCKDEADKETMAKALKDYFYVHQTIHASKVGKRIQASENTLQRQGDKLDEKYKKVTDGIQHIIREINNLKTRQEEEGVFLGEEIEEVIENGITETVDHL